MALWGETRPAPPVRGAMSDAACTGYLPSGGFQIGFVDPQGGNCVGSLMVPDFGVVLAVHEWSRYSQALPHELRHTLDGDHQHARPGTWGPQFGGAASDLVPRANAHLAGLGDLDVIKVRQ
jgi:hypothetical protein